MLSALVRRWRDRREPAQEEPPQPASADWIARGNAALGQGRLKEAQEAYACAKRADPADPVPWLNHGFACLQAGDLATAHEDLRQCLALAAHGTSLRHEAHFLIGRVYAGQGRRADAEAAYQAAVDAEPAFNEARVALAQLWLEAGAPERVLDLAASAEGSSQPLALAHAQALHALGRHEESLAVLAPILEQAPECAPALDGRGVVLLDLGRPAEALVCFDRAVQAGGVNADRLGNLSAACQRLARFDEAVAYANRALELSPGDARVRWNRAMARLLQGDFARGWDDFEARWDAGVVSTRGSLPPQAQRWTGEDLAGRSILLDAEQGLGDTIQFLRYVGELAARGARVAVRVQRPLLTLIRDSLPEATVLAREDAPPRVDFYSELMSLPRHVGTRMDCIPATVPYLQVDPAAAQRWDAVLGAAAQGRLRVGLVWSGNPAHLNDRNRSIALRELQELAGVDALFVSLKPDLSEPDRVLLSGWPRMLDPGPQLRDFADTAAVIQGLDVLVSVDTSVAHLAGALAKPVWVLLPWLPDWRWLLRREDSPWYPTARLYRQAHPQDWTKPLRRVGADLRQLAASRTR